MTLLFMALVFCASLGFIRWCNRVSRALDRSEDRGRVDPRFAYRWDDDDV